MPNPLRKNVILEPQHLEMLTIEAKKQKRSLPYLIREAIEMYCKKKNLHRPLEAGE